MKGKALNRRQWTLLAGAAPLARAQQPAPASGELEQARERLRRSADEVRKVKVDPAVEPAFRFQP